MNFFRNREVKISLAFYIVVSAVFSAIGFLIDVRSGLLIISTCVILTGVFLLSTHKRYKKIAQLTNSIDKILHGDEKIIFKEYNEGELSLLQNEISKMTSRLREQTLNLKDDKIFLANSLADISHQIRTPLTSINLIIAFLSEPNISVERKSELLKELSSLLDRIEWLVNSLLKISKLDAGTAQFKQDTISVQELIRLSYDHISISMDLRNQVFETNINGAESFIGDLLWSVEALSNIMKNCMEHTGSGGTITVSAAENALYTEIVVSDNGKGFKENDLPHLFERFYKGENSSEAGIGIGLSLSRMIVTQQNGTVKAENNQNSGAKFTIRFYKGAV